jgi:hypothetical protein
MTVKLEEEIGMRSIACAYNGVWVNNSSGV